MTSAVTAVVTAAAMSEKDVSEGVLVILGPCIWYSCPCFWDAVPVSGIAVLVSDDVV